MCLLDEPRESGIQPWNRNFADTMQYCDLAHQVAGATTTVTVMRDDQEGVDYTPLADALDIMQTHPWSNSAGLISGSLSQGKPIWFYNTGGNLRLVYGFYQLKWPSDGAWEWHYDWLDSDVFDPFPYSPFNNHWRYTYPSSAGPVATLKYEWASQGITDYRYAATLDRLSREARATGLPAFIAWADGADALLQSLRDDVPEYPISGGDWYTGQTQHFAGIPEGPGCLTMVEQALDSYRQRISEMIMSQPTAQPAVVPQVLLEVHPNERAPGRAAGAGGASLGGPYWVDPIGKLVAVYWWQEYKFAASGVLWVQVCAQNWTGTQNGDGDDDNTKVAVNGVALADYDGIQNGPPGGWQWIGATEAGQRWTLRFLAVGAPGMQSVKIAADQAPVLWWVKVTDLEPQVISPFE